MTRNEIAARELLKESKKATLLDVIKYKVVWLFKVIFGAYMKYVELYDFGRAYMGGRCRMKIVKGKLSVKEIMFKNHRIVITFNNITNEYLGYVVMNKGDDICRVLITQEMKHFIDADGNEIISFKTDDVRCNNFTYYENALMDIVTQLTAKIN